MNRALLYSWTIIVAGLLFVAFPETSFGTEYDIIREGKLTKHGAIVSRPTRAGDGEDDKAFILNGLFRLGTIFPTYSWTRHAVLVGHAGHVNRVSCA